MPTINYTGERIFPSGHPGVIRTRKNNKVAMTESVSDRGAFKFPVYKFDRKDVYRPSNTVKDINSMSTIIRYEIIEANCNPDYDW